MPDASGDGAAVFGWPQVIRLGLVQAALGAVVVLTTSTLNRVMVIELALPALLPGLLVAFHYLVQVARPRMGHGSDVGGRRTPWIIGGVGVLALGGIGAAAAVVLMQTHRGAGVALAVAAFALIGLGVSASGTSLLVLLAKRVAPERRAAAATTVWLMMITGFAVTAGVAGALLDPYSPARLMAVTTGVSALAVLVTVLALRGVEGAPPPRTGRGTRTGMRTDMCTGGAVPAASGFRDALAEVWAEPRARRFTVFVFVAMLAFSAQDLILEPFAGIVFGYTPGQSTSLSGVQHGGVLVGMLLAALAGSRWRGRTPGSLRTWTIAGCLASALALAGLAAAGLVGTGWPLRSTVFLLGAANGVFSIAAIGSMMRLAGDQAPAGVATTPATPREGTREDTREGTRMGTRMGLWGAAQAIAFGVGGMAGAGASDLARGLIGSPGIAYAAVFAVEALLFVVAARLAASVEATAVRDDAASTPATAATAPLTSTASRARWRLEEHHGTV